MSAGRVAVVGSLNFDTTLEVARLPQAGETILALRRICSPGGKGANQAAAAAAAGADVHMVGAVGDDNLGGASLSALAAHRVDVSGVEQRVDADTGTAVVLVGDDGENVIVVDPAANRLLSPAWVTSRLTELRPRVTLVQCEVPLASLVAAARAARDGLLVVNPAPTPPDVPERKELLELADVITPNRSELAALVGARAPHTIDEVDACVGTLGLECDVVVTLGAQGAAVYARSGARTLVDPEIVDVVDSSGAGDVFNGVLAAGLARGEDLVAAARVANRAAAASTTVSGAQLAPGTSFQGF